MKPQYAMDLNESDTNLILTACNKIKSATSELVPCNPILVYFMPYVDHPKYPLNISDIISTNNWKSPIKIVVYKKQNTFVSDQQIKENINKIIVDYFAMTNQKLGSVINIGEVTKKILDLNYIESIETKYIPSDNSGDIVTINGLSFAAYTPSIIARSRF